MACFLFVFVGMMEPHILMDPSGLLTAAPRRELLRHTLNQTVLCQLHLNKTGKKKDKQGERRVCA